MSQLMADVAKREKVLVTLVPVYTGICRNSEKIYNQAQMIKKLNNAGQAIGADTLYAFAKSVIDFLRPGRGRRPVDQPVFQGGTNNYTLTT